MSERFTPQPEEQLSQELSGAVSRLTAVLKKNQHDQVICLGDSVEFLAKPLSRSGLNVTWLNHDDGHRIYQDGSADDQAACVRFVVGDHTNPAVVEDTTVSGGKLSQIRDAFQYAEVPCRTYVVAADKKTVDPDVTVISTSRSLVSELRRRVSRFIDSRK